MPDKSFTILFFGDVVGRPGRRAVADVLPAWKKTHAPDITIANIENIAHGKGITTQTVKEIFDAGVEFATSGNHIWAKSEGLSLLAEDPVRILRPANYPASTPGVGTALLSVRDAKLLVINLLGRVMMKDHVDCPFKTLEGILERYREEKRVGTFVDFHAETTAETNTFGLYADGRVSAVVGTHTHIPTADDRVLPNGTAYITDVGMCGLKNSSIGVNYESALPAFLHQMPARHEIADNGLVVVNAVLIEISKKDGRALSIKRLTQDVEV